MKQRGGECEYGPSEKLGQQSDIFTTSEKPFLYGSEYVSSFLILINSLSEVIRAEAETCFQSMQIKILMLLLFLMINSNLVLTKVKTIQNTTKFYLVCIHQNLQSQTMKKTFLVGLV